MTDTLPTNELEKQFAKELGKESAKHWKRKYYKEDAWPESPWHYAWFKKAFGLWDRVK